MRDKFISENCICVCVDNREGHEIHGRIYNMYDQEPISFNSVIEMMTSIDKLYDYWGFPQRSVLRRSLIEVKSDDKVHAVMHAKSSDDLYDFSNQMGAVATFYIRTEYRENSTWQGVVVKVGDARPVKFESALSLIGYIIREIER